MSTKNFYAHSSPLGTPPPAGWQCLREHLAGVARLSRKLAESTLIDGLPAAAEAAGWLHDLGKYREEFQRFIRGLSPQGSKQHKEAGAAFAFERRNPLLAFAILGHHVGVPDPDEARNTVKKPDGDGLPVWNAIRDIALKECPELTELELSAVGSGTKEPDLFIRLLLSCLVDADWTDTSEHERSVKGWAEYPTPPELQPAKRLAKLLAFIAERANSTREKNPDLAHTRQQILDACLSKGDHPSGLFSLTVPTGGGKTLSGLAFALKHAASHNLRRVIYVAPYISILDQNADVIRKALGVTDGDLTVFEHQSLAEPAPFGPERVGDKLTYDQEKQKARAARRAENWDSPVVVTTNVQFFESLFSNKPGRCRKLHNIAKSVIVLDECQTLPPDLVKPTCQMLKHLTATLGCTVVLCTATQPAFDHASLGEHQLKATPIIAEAELKLFDRLKRVKLEWPKHRDERLTWSQVAGRMRAGNQSALCIVNTKLAALELYAVLQGLPAFHLSTSMCPKHRLAVLDAVKRRLHAKQLVYVVSTQLIEAGVDIDFPHVLREMAPLESIIQAAGRCNREGLIPNAGGHVEVFRSEEGKIPPGWYKKGREVLETQFLAAGSSPSVEDPADILDYFSRLYWQGELDKHNIVGMRTGLKFQSVADAYKLISEDSVPVVVATWKQHESEIERLLDALHAKPIRANFRALAPFQVNVFRHQLPKFNPLIEEWPDTDFRVWRGKYEPEIGLVAEGPDELIV